MTPARWRIAGAVTGMVLVSAGCATGSSPALAPEAASGVIRVVAAENFWGSLAAQLGGDHVRVASIIDSPDADPHEYEPTATDARTLAGAGLVVVNGIGYDTWASKLLAANPAPGRTVLNVGELVGVKPGGNPHRWYNPDDVRRVIDQLTLDYQRIDRADAGDFQARHDTVINTSLKPYFDLIQQIKTRYRGTPVGASESIFAMLAPSLGLNLLTPPSFLNAISEGTDPTTADKATIDAQIKNKQIKVYVYNSQNATPDIQRQAEAAKAAGIPVTTITETLVPAGASFQAWQTAQLDRLRQALAESTSS